MIQILSYDRRFSQMALAKIWHWICAWHVCKQKVSAIDATNYCKLAIKVVSTCKLLKLIVTHWAGLWEDEMTRTYIGQKHWWWPLHADQPHNREMINMHHFMWLLLTPPPPSLWVVVTSKMLMLPGWLLAIVYHEMRDALLVWWLMCEWCSCHVFM